MQKHTFIPLFASLVTITACQLDPKNIGTPDSAGEPSTGDAPSTGTSPTETSPGTGSSTDTSTGSTTDTSTGGTTDTSTGGTTDTGEPVDPACGVPMQFWAKEYLNVQIWGTMPDEPCVLESAEMTDVGLKGALDCPKFEQAKGMDVFEFVLFDAPFPVFPPIGSTINVSGWRGELDISNGSETLILRSEGKLLYASGRALYHDPSLGGPEIYAPLTLARVDLCPMQPTGEFETGMPLSGDGFVCENGARVQLRVSAVGSDDLLLLNGETGMIAAGQTTYAVDVRQAWRMENCAPEGPLVETGVFAFAIAAQ